ncbi:CLUMA_CG008273, isoform A [Clunio marinus]|uniref:CLUMA_CG008273, isoform A n=1 Tax=Clunio marinus TaxID=568069 RepID=A0A1J1I3K4_9DIPT|nr:CLUMA_CG008273, isoform A [Clunio marinus]
MESMKNFINILHVLNRGGSAGVNVMIYTCATDRDYNDWAAQGIIDLGDNENETIIQYGNGKYNATGGPLSVSDWKKNDSFKSVWILAFNKLGYKTLIDFNSKDEF